MTWQYFFNSIILCRVVENTKPSMMNLYTHKHIACPHITKKETKGQTRTHTDIHTHLQEKPLQGKPFNLKQKKYDRGVIGQCIAKETLSFLSIFYKVVWMQIQFSKEMTILIYENRNGQTQSKNIIRSYF